MLKNILKSALVSTTRVSLKMLDKIRKEHSIFCSRYGRTYVENRNTKVVHLYEDFLDLLLSDENILLNNIISYLNYNFVMHPLPW